MRRRDKTSGKAPKTQRPKTLTRRDAPKVGRKSPTAQADEKIELLERRLNEALEQQAATSEVLKVISEFARRTGTSLQRHASERNPHLRGRVRQSVPGMWSWFLSLVFGRELAFEHF